LQEVREDQKAHSTILIEMQQDVAKNTVDLTEHKEGVVQNRERIEKLEEPGKAFKLLKKYLLGAGAIAGSIYAVLRILGYL
jgi:hypothetical protein